MGIADTIDVMLSYKNAKANVFDSKRCDCI